MAPKQKKKPVKAKVVAASAASDDTARSSPPPTKVSLLSCVFMAAVAFLGGVLTPPSLHAVREGSFSAGNASSTADVDIALQYPLPHNSPCSSSNLDNFLHDVPVPGLHIVCADPIYLDGDGEEHPLDDDLSPERRLVESNALRLTFYPGAHAAPLRRRVKLTGNGRHGGGIGSISWFELKMELIMQLKLAPEGPLQQPWAVFTSQGERIVGENDDVSGAESNERIINSIGASGMFVVTQGGNWIWPGVREGFQRMVELEDSRQVTIETLSLRPLVVSIEGFLSEEECDYIATKAKPNMKYSGVSLKDADKGKAASEWRTSQSAFLPAGNDEILRSIEERTASLTRVPRNHQEYTQVLRYGTGEKYDTHHDFFDPSAYKGDPGTMRLIDSGKKNRYATVFWYLTDVDDGGHTIFPRAGGLPPVHDYRDCSRGLKVQPQKGKVIIFYSLDAAGRMDDLSLHGACPVGEDNVKWAANKWIWNAPMSFIRD